MASTTAPEWFVHWAKQNAEKQQDILNEQQEVKIKLDAFIHETRSRLNVISENNLQNVHDKINELKETIDSLNHRDDQPVSTKQNSDVNDQHVAKNESANQKLRCLLERYMSTYSID